MIRIVFSKYIREVAVTEVVIPQPVNVDRHMCPFTHISFIPHLDFLFFVDSISDKIRNPCLSQILLRSPLLLLSSARRQLVSSSNCLLLLSLSAFSRFIVAAILNLLAMFLYEVTVPSLLLLKVHPLMPRRSPRSSSTTSSNTPSPCTSLPPSSLTSHSAHRVALFSKVSLSKLILT